MSISRAVLYTFLNVNTKDVFFEILKINYEFIYGYLNDNAKCNYTQELSGSKVDFNVNRCFYNQLFNDFDDCV